MARGLRRDEESGVASAEVLDDVEVAEAIHLVRAFTVYFHLANTAEQVHRVEDLNASGLAGSLCFADTVGKLLGQGVEPAEILDHWQQRPGRLRELADHAARTNDWQVTDRHPCRCDVR